jgi:SAM-dependent methyltransferase
MFTEKEIKIANKTARNSYAVGKKAIVPQVVEREFSPEDGLLILDFGAGKAAAHKLSLCESGYNVDAYEFGDNIVPGLHIDTLPEDTYDVVYASNVLNVQSSFSMLANTLLQLQKTLKEGGVLIANYPNEPRKLIGSNGKPLTKKEMESYIYPYFDIDTVKFKSHTVWKLTPKNK